MHVELMIVMDEMKDTCGAVQKQASTIDQTLLLHVRSSQKAPTRDTDVRRAQSDIRASR